MSTMRKSERELFLEAFEKPTQIYRYLRVRSLMSPIFLHRNLSYLKARMSRTNAKRKTFKVDSIFSHFAEPTFEFDYLSLTFFGIFDKKGFEGNRAKVDISIGTGFKNMNSLDSIIVQINPIDTNYSTVSIPVELIKKLTLENQNAILNMRIRIMLNKIQMDNSIELEEPVAAYNNDKIYKFELIVFDKFNHCLLSNGVYELKLRDSLNEAPRQGNHISWEEISLHGAESNDFCPELPSLKFKLEWTKEKNTLQNCCLSSRMNGILDCNEKNISGDNNNENETDLSTTKTYMRSYGIMPRVKLIDIASRIIYRFIYNQDLSQQTETYADFNCPWCHLNCLHLYGLLKHLRLCHDRFNFKYTPTECGVLIDVTINELFDSYIKNTEVLLVLRQKNWPIRRRIQTKMLVYRPHRKTQSLSEFADTSADNDDDIQPNNFYGNGHDRLYYHSQTSLPIYRSEFDDDSEGEPDSAWLKKNNKLLIDDFTDVNEGEKEIMIMWNKHLMTNNLVGDLQIPLALDMFWNRYGVEMCRKNLYKNLLLHMCNLFDYGLLTTKSFYANVQKFQQMIRVADLAQK